MKPNLLRSKTPFSRATSWLLSTLSLVVLLAFTSTQALAVCPDSGFEDEDGNLAYDGTCSATPNPDSVLDWNSLAPVEWDEGSAPFRIANELVSGWSLTALEDAQATTSDTAFAGGTKQDDNCAKVKTGKAPNKDDLKRAYISSNTINGDVILNLGWVRIPQNTTSPSAHIGFEFNQGETPCGGDSDGLVQRTEDDMLIVYDFEGGATDTPTITLRRWVLSGTCEVGSNSPPCWGPSQDLTAAGFAEARVNTTMEVEDDLAAPNSGTESVTQTLQLNEFGEAGINLTDAGVFDENVCLAFGTAFAVSRSSGNSANAQMKDLAGPGDINIANCGRVIIRKATDPSGSTASFGFSSTGGLDPASFNLTGEAGANSVKDYGFNVFAGGYSVTEDSLPTGWDFTSLDCSASIKTNGSSYDASSAPQVSFTLKPLDTIDCTYTNTARSTLSVTKAVVNACGNDGGSFTLFIDGTGYTKKTQTGGDGTTVSDNDLKPGSYSVGENDPGSNYTSSISGGDGDCNDGSVSLSAGESVSCTVTNIRRPTVKIVKSVADSSKWDLLIDDGNDGFEYEAVNIGDGGFSATRTITTVASGTGSDTLFGPVVLGEEATDGIDDPKALSGIGTYKAYWRCDNSLGSNTADDTASFTINQLRPGETVTCTVTNIPTAEAACSTGD